MRKLLSSVIGIILFISLSHELTAQWAENKNAREDARYVRVLQGSEEVTVDGVEEEIWLLADSIEVAFGETSYLPGSGYNMQLGPAAEGDSANAVCKFLYKAPYIYLLFRTQDKSVGGRDWEQSDAIIIAFKENLPSHAWNGVPWDRRLEHFYTYGWLWAGTATEPPVGGSPILKGDARVDGGGDTSKTEWLAAATVLGGTSNDSLPDEGWISEHRMNVDSMGFDINGDVLPFSFAILDGDNFLDSNTANNAHTKTWWGVDWNENWYYAALFIDPEVTTSSPASLIPPPDYIIPRLRESSSVTIDGDITDWETDNTLHFRAKYGDDALFDTINGTGDWASGYQLTDWNDFPAVVDGPEVDYWVTYDDENLYVAAEVTDLVVTVPGEGNRKDGISFFMVPRKYVNGSGIFPSKILTVNIDSSGSGEAGDDLVALSDTGGVEFALQLGNTTDVEDIVEIDSGYTVEMKIPFASFSYPGDLGDSVVFIGALVNDIDVFLDIASNYYAKAFWFKQEGGQKAPAWVALGPANPAVGVNDEITIPTSIHLYENYPNPFNPVTTIKFSTNVNADITLSVYNILGQVISVMKKTNVPAGFGEFQFEGAGLSSGVYFYQLKVTNLANSRVHETQVNKMILLK